MYSRKSRTLFIVFSVIGVLLLSCAHRTETARVETQPSQARMEAQASVPPPQAQRPSSIELPLPAGASPGECYKMVYTPAQYETVTERVCTQEPSERVETIPAQYETVEENVCMKEGYKEIVVEPAEYKTVQERIVVEQASTRLEEIPAQYGWVEEKVLVKPEQTVWKETNCVVAGAAPSSPGASRSFGSAPAFGNQPGESGNASAVNEETMCLVTEPAQYTTVKRRVVQQPAHTRTVEIPAVCKTIEKTVMVKPSTTREIEHPPVIEKVQVKKMVAPPQERRVQIPAQYETVTRTVKKCDAKVEWVRLDSCPSPQEVPSQQGK